MGFEQQHPSSAGNRSLPVPAEFIGIGTIIFMVGLAIIVYGCRTMDHGLTMPGGWIMSMMWMPMPGQTWFGATAQFLVMWLGMISVMMWPLMIPAFLATGRRWISFCGVVGGYYTVWCTVGLTVYIFGVTMAKWALASDSVSRLIPFLSGVLVIAAGVFQFSRWKRSALSCCRCHQVQRQTNFQLGCRLGAACCIACAAPMTVQMTLGMMNPVVMVLVTLFIVAERLLPRPIMMTRGLGMITICIGIIMIWAVTARPAGHTKTIDCGKTPRSTLRNDGFHVLVKLDLLGGSIHQFVRQPPVVLGAV